MAPAPSSITERLRAITSSPWFEWTTIAVICVNAVVLALETFDRIASEHGDLLHTLNDLCLAYFVAEVSLRIAACGRHPLSFFRSGWNVFDFVVVFAAFLPGVRENATLLRIVRLLRVFRLVSVLPELRVLIGGLVHALAPLASMAVLTAIFFYIYGMLGWILFDEHDPENWGTLGRALLTLFEMLTLEGWVELADIGAELSPWTSLYFVSFVVITSFVLLNMVIAVVLSSVDEARDQARAQERERELAAMREEADYRSDVLSRLDGLRSALDGLEDELHRRA